jgi:hypothetical protein
VNTTGLLSFILGATDTTKNPDVAPAGIVMLIEVSPQEFIVTGVALRVTTLFPWDAPKLAPLIITWLPIAPVVAETLVTTGSAVTDELTDTLSKLAVANEVVPLLINKPTNTFSVMSMVWLPRSVQFTPSGEA